MATRERPSLAVEERPERGSREARRLRRAGLVPGVLYGGTDSETVSFKVGARELRQLLVGGQALFDLKVGDAKPLPVIVKDQQLHPVREDLLHIDLLEVRLDEKIQAPVTIELTGGEEAPGVKEGGVLEHVTRELNIEALPTDIPDNIVVDVSGLDIAATMPLSDLTPPAGVSFLDPDETVIATVVVPTEVEEPEVEEETELVGEDGEPIEAPEGEEAEAPEEGGGEEAPSEGGDEES